MRFTLEELEKMVSKKLRKGSINRSVEGYPILHSVAIELRDERERNKHQRYFELIEKILQHPDSDPNVFDKHQKHLLAYAAEQDNVQLVSLLLQYEADPNLVDGQYFKTALEWAIYSNAKPEIIGTLNPLTSRTSRMSTNAKELFEQALEEDKETGIVWINLLLDLQLITYKKQFVESSTSESGCGFWIRTIEDPEREQKILERRECYSDEDLAKLRHKEITSRDARYTPYSPATYIVPNIPTSLFGYRTPGIMIRRSSQSISFWYDGHHEELTRDMSYYEGSTLSHGSTIKGQYREISADQIQSIFEKKYKKEIRHCYKEAEKTGDRHGVFLDRSLCEIGFSWNEGLIRYKRKDVLGICVTEDNKESWACAFNISKTLQLETNFYQYNSSTGRVIRHEKEDLIRKWQLTSPVGLSTARSTTPGFDRARQTTSSTIGRSRLSEERSRLKL